MALGKVALCLWLVGWSQICAAIEFPYVTGWGSSNPSPNPNPDPGSIPKDISDPSSSPNPSPSTNLATSIASYVPNFKSVPSFTDIKNSVTNYANLKNSLPNYDDLINKLPSFNNLPGFKSLPNIDSLPNINNFPGLNKLPSFPSINIPSITYLTSNLPLTNLNPVLNILSATRLTNSPTFNEETLSDADKLKKELHAIGEDKSVEELMTDIQQVDDQSTKKLLIFTFTLARFALVASSFIYFPGVYAVIATKVLEFFLQQMGAPKDGDKYSEQNQYVNVVNTVMKTLPQMQDKESDKPPPDEVKIHTTAGKDIVMKLPVSDNTKRASFHLLDAIEVLAKLWKKGQ